MHMWEAVLDGGNHWQGLASNGDARSRGFLTYGARGTTSSRPEGSSSANHDTA